MDLRNSIGALMMATMIGSVAQAAPVVSGNTSGPDGSFSINMFFANDATSTVDITSMSINGGTALAFPMLWDEVGTPGGTATLGGAILGEDTQVLAISFSAFAPGATFQLTGMDPDGDPSPPHPLSVTIGELTGVTVTFGFSDGSSAAYRFVDDPAPEAGLVLAPAGDAVPAPATLALLGAGLLGLTAMRRQRA